MINSHDPHTGGVFISALISLAIEIKTFCGGKWVIPKRHVSHIANFENGGTNIQMGILQVLLNILSIALLSKVIDMYCYFGMRKD